MRRRGSIAILAGLGGIVGLLLSLLSGCHVGANTTPVPGGLPHVETILPAGKEVAYVFPDGRRLFFHSTAGTALLDATTGQELATLPRLARVRWIDDELVYGERWDYPLFEYYVIAFQPWAVVKLETLPAASPTLVSHLKAAGAIYVVETETKEYTLLLLRRDAAGVVSGGYAVLDVHNMVLLLSGVRHKVAPLELLPNVAGEEYPSPDGQFYYLCQHQPAGLDVLEVYSRQNVLLNAVTATAPYPTLTCHGWTWDGRGVYFQTADPAGPPLSSSSRRCSRAAPASPPPSACRTPPP